MISDLLREPLERVDVRVEGGDPLEEEDARAGHQTHRKGHQVGRREEITITEIGMISKGTMKAAT